MGRSRLLIIAALLLLAGGALGIRLASASALVAGFTRGVLPCILLSDKEAVLCLEERVPALYPEYPVGDIFALIGVVQPWIPELADCHFLAHRVGATVVAVDPSNWAAEMLVEGAGSLCLFGYVHGVAIAAFEGEVLNNDEIEGRMPVFKEVCARSNLSESMSRNCYHGVGHMFYFLTGTDIERGLALCDAIGHGNDFEKRLYQSRCHEGVVMKLFLVFSDDEEPDWRGLTADTSGDFCAALSNELHREACHRTSWVLYADEFAQDGKATIDFCSSSPQGFFQDMCYAKVFRGMAWKLLDKQTVLVNMCNALGDQLRTRCYSTAALELFGAVAPRRAFAEAEQFCEQGGNEVHTSCMHGLAHWIAVLHPEREDALQHCRELSSVLGDICAEVL